MRGPLLVALGFLCLAVGAVGVALPVLPTTPFVLLAAGCFGSSSPKLYGWLARSRCFGAFLANYRDRSGLPTGVKARALAFLWGMLALSVLLTRSLHLGIFLALVGVGVTAHILLIKTKRD